MIDRCKVTVSGRVQGVGFRPAVYRYASQQSLAGYVTNTPSGVMCEIEGETDAINRFLDNLRSSPPAQARIDSLITERIPCTGETEFRIAASIGSGDLIAGMPPDLATCEECAQELFDRTNRRYRYPFVNCTNCGPRFTIIRSLPYDRHATSMTAFEMCPVCTGEYSDPANRRFDAQPNACTTCGPSLRLIHAHGEPASGDPVAETVNLLRTGAIVAIKGIGGYHLCCDASSNDAISLLRSRKNRPAKSLAVMFRSIAQLREQCVVTEAALIDIASPAHPVVIVDRTEHSTLPASLSPDTRTIGALLPYTPLHHLLCAEISPIVMTSGNRAEEPIVKDEDELSRILGPIADYALIHNRPIVRRCDDSVLTHASGKRMFIRRSRGYVPDHIPLPFRGHSILACGGEMKNTICVTRNDQAFVSQHIGEVNEYKALSFFKETITDLTGLLHVSPEIIVHDLHPDYQSTVYARGSQINARIAIQHHHAHIAACMAENGIYTPVIGVALDGSGYGEDGTVWGGEFLVGDLSGFIRAGHFKQYPLPGGDAAVLHPTRMALSYCLSETGSALDTALLERFSSELKDEYPVLVRMITEKIHSPLTSSCGRLFDAVSALLGICRSVSYEGQAAIRLETAAAHGIDKSYSYTILPGKDNTLILSFGHMIDQIFADMRDRIPAGTISAAFHNTVAIAVAAMCARIRAIQGIGTVALSGGVFQNRLLLELCMNRLLENGFHVAHHTILPPNDGCISLGQAAIANARYATGNG